MKIIAVILCLALSSCVAVEKFQEYEEKAFSLFCALTPEERALMKSRPDRKFGQVKPCPDE